MAGPIFDSSTLYKILNVQYPNQAADLIYGNPNGPVSGFQKNFNTINFQDMYIVNVGPNQVNVKNGYTETFVFTYTELEGVPLSANAQAYPWTLISVAPGVYRIATLDGAFVWVLEKSDDFFSILLRDANANTGPEAQWTFGSASA